MKIRVVLFDRNAFDDDVVDVAAKQDVASLQRIYLRDTDRDAAIAARTNAAWAVIEKFVDDGCITIVFDTETGTAVVEPR
jgi:hypothetical protein